MLLFDLHNLWETDEETDLREVKSLVQGPGRGKDSTHPKNSEGAVGSFICAPVMAPGSRLLRGICLSLQAKRTLGQASGCPFWSQSCTLLGFTTGRIQQGDLTPSPPRSRVQRVQDEKMVSSQMQ